MASEIDYDLEACLQYNPQPSFTIEDVKKVLAIIEGENDGPDWHWILLLNDDRFIYLRGGCDYTGWDCQSSATHIALETDMPLHKAVIELKQYEDDSELLKFTTELQRQIEQGKSETWRERKDKEFGI